MRKLLVFVVLCMLGTVAYSGVVSKAYVDGTASDIQEQINSRANNYGYTPERVLQTDSSGNVTADLLKTGMISDGAVTNSRLASGLGLDKLDVGELPTSGKHIMIWNGTTQKYVFERYTTGILPEGYTQLEYIESTGTQYIDTGYIPNKNTITSIRFMSIESSKEVITKLLLGNIGIYNNNGFLISFCPRTRARQRFGDSWFDRTNYWTSGILFDVSMDSSGQTVNGVQTNWESEPSNYMISKPLLLFGQPDFPDRFSNARVFYVNIREKDIVKLNFVPAKRNSDGEIGMYDTVTKIFFTNAGTGNFIAGPEI